MKYNRVSDDVFGLTFEERHCLLARIIENDYEHMDEHVIMWCDVCKANTTHKPRYTTHKRRLFITRACRDCKILRGESDHSSDHNVFQLTSEERHHLLLRMLDTYDDTGCCAFKRCVMCDMKTSGYHVIYSKCQRVGCQTLICQACRTDGDGSWTFTNLYRSYTCTHHRHPTLHSMSFRLIKYGII